MSLKYELVEVFLSGVDQSKVDKSTEEWLDGIEDRLDYGKWYCRHYHTENKVDRAEIIFENFGVFCDKIVSKEREENEIWIYYLYIMWR